MKNSSRLAVGLAFSFSAAAAVPTMAQQTAPASSASSVASPNVDNTKTNMRDRSGATVQPTSQPNDKADIKVAAAVRRAIVKDKSLSMSAHNVKLVAAGGVVTLRGPVNSDDEKAKVQAIATGVAGVTSVDNQLDVKTHSTH